MNFERTLFDQTTYPVFEEIQFKASTSQVAIIKLVLITVYRTKKQDLFYNIYLFWLKESILFSIDFKVYKDEKIFI